jgi:hypothetical protein
MQPEQVAWGIAPHRSFLILAGQPGITHDIGRKNCS